MSIEIGSYEAKTRLPELLRGVLAGKRYIITLRGHPVAELIPAAAGRYADAAEAARQMKQWMQAAPETGAGVDLKALVDEGRS